MFKQWIFLNGDEGGSLYMTFSDEELEQNVKKRLGRIQKKTCLNTKHKKLLSG